MQRLQHRNIVRYLGVAYDAPRNQQYHQQPSGSNGPGLFGSGFGLSNDDDTPLPQQLCIFMEYMPMGSLKQVMRKFALQETQGLPLLPLLHYL